MIIEPNSNIRLMKSSIELDSINQLTFNSKAAQESYFKSLQYVQIEDSSYQRKDGYIRFPVPFDEAIKYNYCMYQNEGYSNKWFYAFVTNVEYLNDETSAVYIETDVFQTWQFDMLWRESFIEREMLATADDIAGANTQPENVELGDYVLNERKIEFLDDKTDYIICMAVTELPDSSFPPNNNHRTYNGIFGGLFYLGFNTADDCEKAIGMYDKKGKADAIDSLFIIPKDIASVTDGTSATWTLNQVTCNLIYLNQSSNSDLLGNIEIPKPTKLGKNYTPKNKKLFTYPYCFFNLTNNVGTTEIFRYEDFELDDTVGGSFWVEGSLSPGMSTKAYPLFYKNENLNWNYGIIGGKLPVCSWSSDVYLNYLTQNALNIPISLAGSALQITSGALLGAGGATQIGSGIFGIASSISQIYQASLTPDQAKGNVNASDINFSSDYVGLFSVYQMSIKDEYARIIDNFFSMFGYKTNLVKLPNLNNRSNWNYVKTINANIIGDIPQKDMQKIKDLFNNGITLWHNPNTFLDYSQTNS